MDPAGALLPPVPYLLYGVAYIGPYSRKFNNGRDQNYNISVKASNRRKNSITFQRLC